MSINLSKSCCLRIGPRSDVNCASVNNVCGLCLPWVTEMRYLGVYIVRSKSFKCSVDESEKKFYRAANGIVGKIGRQKKLSQAYTLFPVNVCLSSSMA